MRLFNKSPLITAAIVAALSSLVLPASAQAPGDFPTRPIRIVIPFAAGGGNDILARIVGARASELLGQTIVMENKPGAGGRLAAEYVLQQPKDGYTVLLGASGGMSIAAAIYPNLPYHPTKSFVPLTMIAEYPLIISVKADLPVKTIKELAAYVNARPEKANYPASSPAFAIGSELLKLQTGMKAQRIPYKSSNEMVMSVIQGDSLFAVSDVPPVFPMIQEGRIRALAVTTQQRSPELPEIPSMAEVGYPKVNYRVYSGLFAATGVPKSVVDKLESAFVAAVRDKKVADRIKQLGASPGGSTSSEFREYVDNDVSIASEIVKTANLKFED